MSTSFLGLQIPVSPMNIIRGAAVAIGGLGFAMAAHAVTSPTSYAVLFGFPPGSPIASTAHKNPFIAISGGRTMAYSVALLGCVYFRYDRAMSLMLMSGCIGATIDGFSLIKHAGSVDERKVGKEREAEVARARKARDAAWQHWTLMPLISGLGLWAFMNSDH